MQPFWKQMENNSSRTIRVVRIVLLFLIIIGITLLSTQKLWVQQFVSLILKYEVLYPTEQHLVTDNSQRIASTSSRNCVDICDIFDFQKYFEGEVPFGSDQNYKDHLGKHTVTLRALPDEARNIPVEIYVDGKLVGETGGRGMLQASFSPDDKYFAFLVQATMNCCEIWRGINVVNLSSSIVEELPINPVASKENSKFFITPEPFIESYTWGENSTIFVTGYPVGIQKNNQYYRVNSKQVWSFDLTNSPSATKDSVTVKTIPE